MQRIAFLLFFLACVGHGRRMQISAEQLLSDKPVDDKKKESLVEKVEDKVKGAEKAVEHAVEEVVEKIEEELEGGAKTVEKEGGATKGKGSKEKAKKETAPASDPVPAEPAPAPVPDPEPEGNSTAAIPEIVFIAAGAAAVVFILVVCCVCCCGSLGTRAKNCCAKKLEGPQTLRVTVVKATNLKSLNVTGDAPYCKVMVVPKGAKEMATNTARHLVTSKSTKALKGDLNPEWNEQFLITGWYESDDIIFDLLDEGITGVGKREARIILSTDQFYPVSFNSSLTIDAATFSYLYVKVEYVGPTTA